MEKINEDFFTFYNLCKNNFNVEAIVFSDKSININDESEEAVSNEENIENEEEIKKYLSEVFKIPVEKIKLYSMGG